MAYEPQALDSIPLIRRKRAGEGGRELSSIEESAPPAASSPELQRVHESGDTGALRMKPKETVQLAPVHVRIPEQIARGLRLMSVLESEQAQVIVARSIERTLDEWNPRWRDSVVPRA